METVSTPQAPEPLTDTIERVLGADMQGVANALNAFVESRNIRTINALIASISKNINDVGNFQFVTSEPNRHERLGLEQTGPVFPDMTVIVEQSLVADAVQKLLAA